MSQPWHSLFLPATGAAAVVSALHTVLDRHGYTAYDPFPGGTGTPPRLAATVRHMVAPASGGWVRVLGEPDADTLLEFQVEVALPVLVGWLTEEDGGFVLLRDGERHTDPDAFADFLRDDQTLETLRAAFAGTLRVEAVDPDEPSGAVVGADTLPPELRAFARQQGVDVDKASSLVERLGGKLLGRFDSDADDGPAQVHTVLHGAGGDTWNSLRGQRVRALAQVLALPDNWRTPSWQQVRDAYQVFRLRERSPRMMLMPGDREAMALVPDALDYTPVYMGRPQ